MQEELQAAQDRSRGIEEAQALLQSGFDDARVENERLLKHVADLESRKRPPLYQRKQEEELQVRILALKLSRAVF